MAMRREYKAVDSSVERMTQEAKDGRELVQVVVFPSSGRVGDYTSSYAIMKRRIKPERLKKFWKRLQNKFRNFRVKPYYGKGTFSEFPYIRPDIPEKR